MEQQIQKVIYSLNMKKFIKVGIVFLFVTGIFNTHSLFAEKNPVSLKSGSISVLKTPSEALLEVDYSEAKVGDKTIDEYLQERGEDFVRDWTQDKEQAASQFKRYFNKKNKGMKLTADEALASYKLVIRVQKLDMGKATGAIFLTFAPATAGGCIMTGTIDIIDLRTTEVVCNFFIDEVQGVGNFSETMRLANMYVALADYLCRLKK